ncbi:MAG: homocysteine S-methyltransferase family protein [Saprospiraceae bacterium]|nr:homocysteine S-methyltransferase family protein [Saprospiraceae bacterium]
MQSKEDIYKFITKRNPCILDGAIGTCLEQQGIKTELPLWTAFAHMKHPQRILDIHKAYIDAGADIISANTWRASYYLLEKTGHLDRLDRAIEEAASLGRQAWTSSTRSGLLAASIAPLEDCYQPSLAPSEEMMHKYHDKQLSLLAAHDFDLLMAETINTKREAIIIAHLANHYAIPVTISFITDGDERLLSGELLTHAIDAIAPLEPVAILLNCRSVAGIAKGASVLSNHKGNFLKGIYPNGPGKPDEHQGWIEIEDSVSVFRDYMFAWAGTFHLLGGCCGTTPAHIASLKD